MWFINTIMISSNKRIILKLLKISMDFLTLKVVPYLLELKRIKILIKNKFKATQLYRKIRFSLEGELIN